MTLSVYVCKRGDWWEGALLIAAADEEDAVRVFVDEESSARHRKEPAKIELMDGVTAYGEPRVLYDDQLR